MQMYDLHTIYICIAMFRMKSILKNLIGSLQKEKKKNYIAGNYNYL